MKGEADGPRQSAFDSMISPTLGFLRQHFARATSSVTFIPQIDGLRSLALLFVMAHHVFAIYLVTTHRLGTQSLPHDWALIAPRSALINWALHLSIGVPIFCVISGFVLAIPFARQYQKGAPPPSVKLYLLRRLIRMEPPYVLSMVLIFLLLINPWHRGHLFLFAMWHQFFPHLLASLVYLHAPIYYQPSWINGVAWTLEIEVQFYVVLPLAMRVFLVRRNSLRRFILTALVLASSLFAQYGLPAVGSIRLSLSLATQLQFFLVGVLLADIYLDPPRRLMLGRRVADAVVIANGALLVYVMHWKPQFAWIEPFLVAGFFFGVFYGAWSSRLFRLPVLTIPGGMCYTIYLYHYFILQKLLPYTVRILPGTHALWLDFSIQFALMLPPIMICSAIFFLFSERPFILLSHTVAQRLRPVRALTAEQAAGG